MSDKDKRPGEVALPIDPAEMAGDASLVFIGRIRSPWQSRAECPRNLVQAREQGKPATIEIDEVWRAGLMGLEHVSHIIVLYWMQQARRDLIIQIPRNRPDPKGVFSIRSPVRPNSIAMATVRILDVDQKAGLINIDAIDCLDGTPLLDIKPWFEAIDAFPVQDGVPEK
jgi:tRNA (adenine37-N6)-methyltransferase